MLAMPLNATALNTAIPKNFCIATPLLEELPLRAIKMMIEKEWNDLLSSVTHLNARATPNPMEKAID
jgi:hypothetical protein